MVDKMVARVKSLQSTVEAFASFRPCLMGSAQDQDLSTQTSVSMLSLGDRPVVHGGLSVADRMREEASRLEESGQTGNAATIYARLLSSFPGTAAFAARNRLGDMHVPMDPT